MSRMRIKTSREFLQAALDGLRPEVSVALTFIAEIDGRKASVEGHVVRCAADDSLSFTFEVPAVRLAQ